MKHVAILGSTGSIGTQALEVARLQKDIQITALCANTNVELLERQIREFKPRYAAMMNERAANELKIKTADTDTKILSGMDGFVECVHDKKTEMVLTAVVGVIGLIPTIEAIKGGKDIALANKETLVAGGHLVMPLAEKHGINILPVDSEHSAIFQSKMGQNAKVKKILLTASGGPFFGQKDVKKATVKQALAHPNWNMGAKITVDSATLMNKGLEMIEASWLFDVDIDCIQVVVQRQSIIHSMVQFEDNSVIAQLSMPDMKQPISLAFSYPERKFCGTEEIDFYKLSKITFDKPDCDTFKCLPIAITAAKRGGSMPAFVNGANEKAVELFLKEKITFGEIAELIEKAASEHNLIEQPCLEDIIAADKEARLKIEGMVK